MILQAYIDDSGDDEVFTLGGYVATAERWAKFSEQWKDVLEINRLDYFKMKEMSVRYAQNMEKELDQFVNVIDNNVEYEISFSVRKDDIVYVCDFYGLSEKDRNPYFLAFNSIISATEGILRETNNYEGIEFIFDEQPEKGKVFLAWDGLFATASTETKKFLKGAPIFRSDADFMPLQGADMAAWWARKFFKSHNFDVEPGSIYPWRSGDRHPEIIRLSIDRDGMRKQIRKAIYLASFPLRLLSDFSSS